jgi:5,10-methylenetetrahydromethanopterin reductase
MQVESTKHALGVVFLPSFPSETLAVYAQKAEARGFDELWLWDDCFQPGALTSAAIALGATRQIKVGIGLMPATVYNPLFAAMEITTLARAFPRRFLPGFGHGVDSWMAQIGAAQKSSLRALEETVTTVRRLLAGEKVTFHGTWVNLEGVQLRLPPENVPPLYVGAMRPRTLRLAGRAGDGTILPAMTSPAYVRWAWQHARTGIAESGRSDHRLVAYLAAKVGPDGAAARAVARRSLAEGLTVAEPQLNALGIRAEAAAMVQAHGVEGAAQKMPDEWVDALSAAGTPEQAAGAVQRLFEAGADSVILQPMEAEPDALDAYIQYLMPLVKVD